MRTINRMVVCYLFAWALSYIFTAIFAPQVSGDALWGTILYTCIGVALSLSLLLMFFKGIPVIISRVMLVALGILSVYASISSWCGTALWNVPFPNKEIFQVSMATANLIAAFLMFFIASTKEY